MKICVFCGASTGNSEIFQRAAHDLGKLMATQGIDLIYGGGGSGLMGIIANAVLEANGKVTGIFPKMLNRREAPHGQLTEEFLVDSMHERKQMMADLADAFIAMPGGIGTLDELFEIWTWKQLSIHHKPVAILNIDNYFAPLLEFVDQLVAKGFLSERHRELVIVDPNMTSLLEKVKNELKISA